MEIERTGLSGTWKSQHSYQDFRNIMRMVNDCNIIKYAAYRTAAKLRVLQRALHMDNVRLRLMAGVFERHHLQVTENGMLLEYSELESIIYDIFFAAQKETMSGMDVDSTTELTINLLMNIYDGRASGTVQVLSVKVALAVLSPELLQEKYEYVFNQLADHNNCVSSNKMEIFLKNLTSITENLNESTAFGSELVSLVVDSCFQHSQGMVGITEDIFMKFLMHDEPQLVSWLSALNRMQMTELVNHHVKCNVCKVYPIIGLRYKCLDCLRYNQCQTCFFTGKINKKHKLRHIVQEYCHQTSSREMTFAFFRIIKNKLCGNSSKMQYLSVQPHDISETREIADEVAIIRSVTENQSNISTPKVISESGSEVDLQPQKALQYIISHLENESRFFQQVVKHLAERKEMQDLCESFQGHCLLMNEQVERLKKLKHSLSKILPFYERQMEHLQSTPLLSVSQKYREPTSFDDISPIVRETDVNKLSAGMQELKLLSCQLRDEMKCSSSDMQATEVVNNITPELPSLSGVSARDLSTWVAGTVERRLIDPSTFSSWLQESRSKETMKGQDGDFDEMLEKLQQMLSSSFSLEESFSSRDNIQLQQSVKEMEDILTSLIKSIENKRNAKD